MKDIMTQDDVAEAKYHLELFLISNPLLRLESSPGIEADRGHSVEAPPARIELTVEWGKLILSWWDGERSERLRIIGYAIE